ncbi:hypothetical protein TCAL_07097 [Tigriopus californicus]|uniref:Uncharacterized protein n=1 Tax=Tigriopus californicus TaxID=6832 RepID=A0A553PB39_TIGCA|nr:hypothetical protein TCAL_07097 [Tigriopus californicus]|eukprot:TCALIF_07097-PA protein Name:"Protein of unknown function" AED:0.00 eAED:0.00 QI:33/1/1/1/1/1/2/233/170
MKWFLILSWGVIAGSATFCTYLERLPITSAFVPPDCTARCNQICVNNPGYYFCTGRHVFTDTSTRKLEESRTGMFAYCICTRSEVTRSPGAICGPTRGNEHDCPNPPTDLDAVSVPPAGQWIDGHNTFIDGHQGKIAARIKEDLALGLLPTDVNRCDDTLMSQTRNRLNG